MSHRRSDRGPRFRVDNPSLVLLSRAVFLFLISTTSITTTKGRPNNVDMRHAILTFMDRECRRLANKEYAERTTRYFKGVHSFYGVKSPELRSIVRNVQSEYRSRWTAPLLLETAERLLAEPYGEKKLLAVYLLGHDHNLKLLRKGNDDDDDNAKATAVVAHRIGELVERYVADWATCDGLSSQVVRRLMTEGGDSGRETNDAVVEEVRSWSKSTNDWKQRASCVSLLCLARRGAHNEVVTDVATRVVRNSSRFPQLGVGWVLRELSLADRTLVVEFIKAHYDSFSREGLRYAIEKMERPLQQELLRYGKKT